MKERATRGVRLMIGAIGLAIALGVVLYWLYR
jgi:hypothetical protein